MLPDRGLQDTGSLVIPAIARTNRLFRFEKASSRTRRTQEKSARMGAARHFSPTTPSRRNALEVDTISTPSADRSLHLVNEEYVIPRRSSETIARALNVAIAA